MPTYQSSLPPGFVVTTTGEFKPDPQHRASDDGPETDDATLTFNLPTGMHRTLFRDPSLMGGPDSASIDEGDTDDDDDDDGPHTMI